MNKIPVEFSTALQAAGLADFLRIAPPRTAANIFSGLAGLKKQKPAAPAASKRCKC